MVEVTLVDYFSFFYRAALVSFTQQLSVNGETTGILFNLYRSYYYILKNFKNVVFCIDGRVARSFRKQQFSDYKSNREIMRNKYQKLDIYKWKDVFMETIPYYYGTNESYEGDDIIASLVGRLCKKNIKVNILTLDTDLWQLIDFGKVDVYDLKHRYRYVDYDYFLERFNGLKYPQLIPLYKVIFGDPSDNIPKAIKPHTRKKPLINILNTLYQQSIFKDLDILLLEVYRKEKDKFAIHDTNQLLTFLHLIELQDSIYVDIKYSKGCKQKYQDICKKYLFKKVPKFDDFEYMLSRNSGGVRNIFGVDVVGSEVDEML